VTARVAASRQAGVILAMALMFLALMTATAAVGPAAASLELVRAGALDAWSRADGAAGTGLQTAIEEATVTSTAPAIVLNGPLPAAQYSVRSEFLGFRSASAEATAAGLVEWHFLLTSIGTAGRGARVVQGLQVAILAPEPADRDDCLAAGCPVPPMCLDAPACETELRSAPLPVGWHLVEDPS
jgi:hypothetical protein